MTNLEVLIISSLIAILIFILCPGCGSHYSYYIEHNHTTKSGWKLDISDVDVTEEWLNELDDRLNRISDCVQDIDGGLINKDEIIIKFAEQIYFSQCEPPAGQETEEFLEDDAPEYGCTAKKELAGRDFNKCPCKWRTIKQNNNIVVPMVSGKTRVDQLNLWSILEVYSGIHDFWDEPFSSCWNVKGENNEF